MTRARNAASPSFVRRVAWGRCLFAVLVGSGWACLMDIPALQSTLPSLPDVATGDGGLMDARLDASDAGGAGPNLLFNGGYEEAACDGWISYNGTITPDSMARTGTTACRVCRKIADGPSDKFVSFYPPFGSASAIKNLPVGRYTAEAWVRKAPGSPDFSGSFLNANFADRTDAVPFFTEGGHQIPTSNWSRIGVIFDAPSDAGGLALEMSINSVSATTGACLLIDDVSVRLASK